MLKKTIVNREFCKNSKKWQYQDNHFSLPDGVSADDENVSGDFILEISKPAPDLTIEKKGINNVHIIRNDVEKQRLEGKSI